MITIENVKNEEVKNFLSTKVFGVRDAVKEGDTYKLPTDIAAALAPRVSTTEYTVKQFGKMLSDGDLSPKAAAAFVTSEDGLLKVRTSPYVVILCPDGKELALGTLCSYGTCNKAEEKAAADAKADGKECISLKGAAISVLNGIEPYAGKTLRVVYRQQYDQPLASGRVLKGMTLTAFVEE